MLLRPFLLAAAALVLLAPRASAQNVLINEFMASNDTTISDPDFGESGDWIEIANLEDFSVDLTGFYLTDDLDKPTKWRIPDGTQIPRNGYLLFWADDKETGVHTNFKLSGSGEFVGLFSPSVTPVDTLSYGDQETDVSYGRYPDVGGAFAFFAAPTPGAANDTEPSGGVAEMPTVSLAGGFHSGAQTVTLSLRGVPADATVRYTLDGSPPTEDSPAYSEPLVFDATGVLRAATFAPGALPSPIVTRTYLIDEDSSIAVVTLVTDPDNFFSNEAGIYVRGTNGIVGRCSNSPVNWNQDWERPVHVGFYEPDGSEGFAMDAGVKIFGGCSRLYPQKSLVLKARGRYGSEAIEYQVFPNLDLDRFDDLVLRSSAQDWYRTMFRDGMIQTLTQGRMNLDTQAYRPAIVFLNGEYWGIHNLREQMNADWAAAHYDVKDDEVELMDGAKAQLRDRSEHYDALLDYLGANDLASGEAYAYVQTQIDVDEYLDYQIAQIYSANSDWPGNNLKLWRPLEEGGRWRWMLFDTDFGFGGNGNGLYSSNTLAHATEPNGPDWPNPPWSTYLFRSLLKNDTFRHAFIQRMAAHMNTTYDRDRVLSVIDSLGTNIASEIPRHKDRWTASISFGSSWDDLVEIMREFARRRPSSMRAHMYEYFSEVSGSAWLNLEASEGGQVLAEGVAMPRGAFRSVFYRDVPVTLTAVPDEGYVFTGWQGASGSADPVTSVTLSGQATLTATFALETAAEDAGEAPINRLGENHPNPFGASAQIEVEHARAGHLSLRVYDLLGREMMTLVDEDKPAGTHRFTLDAGTLSSGVYIYAMESDGFRASRRMVVLK